MVCAMSIDDGPDGRWTPQILDLLYDAGAHATFFVLGAHIGGNEPLLQRMVDEGHEVGNHGWSHQHLPTLTTEQLETDLRTTSQAIHGVLDEWPTLWRAPYLDRGPREDGVALGLGLTHVGCDVIPADWTNIDAQQIAQRSLDGLRNGGILLLHDGIPPDGGSGTQDRQPTCDALALLLDTPGVQWVKVSDLG